MENRAELAWEAENGPKFSAAAFASAALTLVAVGLQLAIGTKADNDRAALAQIHDNSALFVTSGVLQALSVGGIAVMAFFFRRAITARLPATLALLWPLAYAAPVTLLVGNVLGSLHRLDLVSEYFDRPAAQQTIARASDVVDDLTSNVDTIGNTLALVGLFALAITFVNLGVNGMRAGLFSRFIGILGVICGVLSLPFFGGAGAGSFIQLFWTVAVGFLLLDRWPNGRGPAWSTVEAIRWPSAAAVARESEGGGAPDPGAEEEPANGSGEAKAVNPRAARKRKKKKRR